MALSIKAPNRSHKEIEPLAPNINERKLQNNRVQPDDVAPKLKGEFHPYNESTHYKYSCVVNLRQEIYRSKVTIKKKSIIKKRTADANPNPEMIPCIY